MSYEIRFRKYFNRLITSRVITLNSFGPKNDVSTRTCADDTNDIAVKHLIVNNVNGKSIILIIIIIIFCNNSNDGGGGG